MPELDAINVAKQARSILRAAPYPGTAALQAQALTNAAQTLRSEAEGSSVVQAATLLQGQWGAELSQLQERVMLLFQYFDGEEASEDPEVWSVAADLMLFGRQFATDHPERYERWQATYGDEDTAVGKLSARGDFFQLATLANQLHAAAEGGSLLWQGDGPLDVPQRWFALVYVAPFVELAAGLTDAGAAGFPVNFDPERELRALSDQAETLYSAARGYPWGWIAAGVGVGLVGVAALVRWISGR